MTGQALSTFITGLNAEATIDATLLTVLVNNAKAILEEERPWMVLRKTSTSLAVTTANTWQTAKSLSTITDFSRFYGEYPIVLFDGTSLIQHYRMVPFDRRLDYKDVSGTFVYDENAGIIYLNGLVPFSGTLYINYVSATADIDLASASTVWSPFPTRFVPIIGYYAIGINKGAIDYDDINRNMLPYNGEVFRALKVAMEKWDNERQLSTMEHNDPTDLYAFPRLGHVDRYADT
jgi:hypothetical protein